MWQQQNLSHKKIFLIDSIGALITAFMLGLVLPKLESVIGMPANYLFTLSAIALVFSSYSFLCFLKVGSNWSKFLTIIAVANLLYCCLTISLVAYRYADIKLAGILYFGGEAIVIIVLAIIEFRYVFRIKHTT